MRNLQSWTKTSINIVVAEVQSEKDFTPPDAYVIKHYPYVRYRFRVNDKTIENEKSSYDIKSIWSEDENEARNLLEEILEEKSCYYNPDNPHESVLIRKSSQNRVNYYIFVFFGGLTTLALAIILFAIT